MGLLHMLAWCGASCHHLHRHKCQSIQSASQNSFSPEGESSGSRRRCKWLEILLLMTMVQSLVCYSCGNRLSLSLSMHLYARAGLVCARITLLNLVACSHRRNCVAAKRPPLGNQCGASVRGNTARWVHPSRTPERRREPEPLRVSCPDGKWLCCCLLGKVETCHALGLVARDSPARKILSFSARALLRCAREIDMQAEAWARSDRRHMLSIPECPDHVCEPTYSRECEHFMFVSMPNPFGVRLLRQSLLFLIWVRRVGEAQNPGPKSLVTLSAANVTRLDKHKDEIVPLNYDLLALTETSAHASEPRRLPKHFAKEGF